MKHLQLMDKYPLNVHTIAKNETTLHNADEVINFIKTKIDAHPVATYIATFDHYSHTKSLENFEMDENFIDAKNIIFCFGVQLPKAEMLGIRPRSIGVVETADDFVLSFMDAPNPKAQEFMMEWVEAI
ncbi:MAG: hypothetical protein DSZ12_06770 [Sulfurovum sp.]|nr:MAG: hypothetical protein DSZ08_00225 [Sulfurovum sp.]RUM73735.1 MAG: hypothetical protein DSZ12_06770 [Sulfurovum sp.]